MAPLFALALLGALSTCGESFTDGAEPPSTAWACLHSGYKL